MSELNNNNPGIHEIPDIFTNGTQSQQNPADNYSFESQPGNSFNAYGGSDIGPGYIDEEKLSIGSCKTHARADINWKKAIGSYGGFFLAVVLASVIIALPASILGFADSPVFSLIQSILIGLLTAGLEAGLIMVFLDMKRKQNSNSLFSRMGKAPGVFVQDLLVEIIAGLPVLLGMIPLAIGLIKMSGAPVFLHLPVKASVMIGIGSITFLAGLVVTVLLSLGYALSKPFYIDKGLGIVQAMKESRHKMKGYKAMYFFMNLSFIGWIMLSSVFILITGSFLGTLPTFFMKEVSEVGMIVAACNVAVIAIIAFLPITIYMQMAKLELYEHRSGDALNSLSMESKKKPGKLIAGVAIISLVFALLSSVALALPVKRVPAGQSISLPNYYVLKVDKGSISIEQELPENIPGDISDENEYEDVEDLSDQDLTYNEENTQNDSAARNSSGIYKTYDLTYTIPSEYINEYLTYNGSEESYASFFDDNSNSIFVNYLPYGKLEYEKDYNKNGTDTQAAGHNAYRYKNDSGYGISIESGENIYSIVCTKEETLDQILASASID